MKINIIVDSGADYTSAEIKKYGLHVLPLKLSFGETMYRDGLDISMEEFYTLLKTSDELPKTSQICPYEYESHSYTHKYLQPEYFLYEFHAPPFAPPTFA